MEVIELPMEILTKQASGLVGFETGCRAPGRRWSRRSERSRGDGQASRDRLTLRSSIAGRNLLVPVRLDLAGHARTGSRRPASGMPQSRPRSSPVRSPDSQRQRVVAPKLVVDVLVTRQRLNSRCETSRCTEWRSWHLRSSGPRRQVEQRVGLAQRQRAAIGAEPAALEIADCLAASEGLKLKLAQGADLFL